MKYKTKVILLISIGSIVIICLFILNLKLFSRIENDKIILTTENKNKINTMSLYNNERMPRIIVCHYKDYPYLKEYIESISLYLKNTSLIIYTEETAYFTGSYNYMSIRRLPYIKNSINPPSYNNNIKVPCNIVYSSIPYFSDECKVGYLNTEHYTDIVNLEHTKKYLHKSIDYYDYSQSNINIYGHGIYLPYTLMQDEFDKLKLFSTLSMNKSKLFDIGIVGTKSPRRDIIVNKIRDNNITIDYIEGFGDSRDMRIGQCKILLNIHMYDEWNVYESIRCERWRFIGMPIISEKCIDPLPNGIIMCTYDNVISVIKENIMS